MNLIISMLLFVLFFSCCKQDEGVKPVFFNLEISSVPLDGGIVEVIDVNTNVVIVSHDSIEEGTKIRLRAIPNQGFSFSGFWGNGKFLPEDEPTIIISRDNSIQAAFRSDVGTPVGVYGDLSVDGSKIVDSKGIPVQLRGMSFFWSQWIGKYYNADVVSWLANDWEVSIVRAAMAVDETGGYLFNRTEKNKVESVINAAIQSGIYVIIDWHSHHAEDYTDEAVEFFSEMAQKYGDYPNVIYEIYNEPLNISWNNTLKPYAEKVIAAIRKHDTDNIIVVGTPNWCQDVDAVIGNTIDGQNIAYSFHFYASEVSHRQNLFTKATNALDAGIPLFVTEWGVSEASGDGSFNKSWTREWLEFMDEHKLSWCNWSVADKSETSAALLPSANTNGGWLDEELSPAGKYIRELLRSHKGYSNPK